MRITCTQKKTPALTDAFAFKLAEWQGFEPWRELPPNDLLNRHLCFILSAIGNPACNL